MRDGTILRADVYRPADPGSYPVLVMRTPYDKHALFHTLYFDVLAAARRGFIVVQQDTRGRFESDGEWLPWAYEQEDGYDTIEWAGRLPGSNGKVGMFGGSYTGQTQWATAIAKAPSLVAIAPQITWSDPEDGLMFRGGAIELGLNAWWALSQSAAQLPKVLDSPHELLRLWQASSRISTLFRPRVTGDCRRDRCPWLPGGVYPTSASNAHCKTPQLPRNVEWPATMTR